jgi:hypothetical protein
MTTLTDIESRLASDRDNFADGYSDQSIRDRAALVAMVREAGAKALEEAASDFEDNMGVGEFDEWARRDGRRWTHIDDAWEYQGPYMDWLRARAAYMRDAS